MLPQYPPPPTHEHPAVVGLAGSPHLWFTDADELLHWGGDTRALAGRSIPWNNRIEVSQNEICSLPADQLGDPWLSAGLLKQGDPIYLVKWETEWAQPKLLHIRSIRDVEAFGVNETNYGDLVFDVPTWEARYGLSVADLERGVLAPVCTPPPTPTPTPAPAPTVKPTSGGSSGGSTAAPSAPSPARPRLTASNIGRHTATLTLTNYTGSWYYQYTETDTGTAGQCSDEQTGATANVTGLTENKTYTFQVYSEGSCSTALATAASFTTPEKSLTWSALTATTVTLNIAGHTGNWYGQANKAPHTSCSNTALTDTTVALSGLSVNTRYTYTAYSDNTCSTKIAATEAFTTLKPALAASNVTATTATLTLSGWVPASDGDWYYQADKAPHTTCSSAQSATTADLTGLTKGTTYTYTAYSDSNCTGANEIATRTVTTTTPALTVSKVFNTTATLTLTGWDPRFGKDDYWRYKADKGPHATCSSSQSATTAGLDGLTKGTTYTYTAYDLLCTTEIAAASPFTTLNTSLTVSNVGATAATLTLTGWTGDWYYKPGGSTLIPCSSAVTTDSVKVTGLEKGRWYSFDAYGDSGCNNTEIASSSDVRTLTPSLAVSNVTAITATLTLSGWNLNTDGNWYYKADKAPHTSCSSAQSAATAALTALSVNTTYTYKAYSDNTCTSANEIVTASAFTTSS